MEPELQCANCETPLPEGEIVCPTCARGRVASGEQRTTPRAIASHLEATYRLIVLLLTAKDRVHYQ